MIFAPTQRYGYVQAGTEAAPDVERAYIDQVRQQVDGVIADGPVPLDEANHRRCGMSSTPSIVLHGGVGA